MNSNLNSTAAIRLNAILSVAVCAFFFSVSFWAKNPIAELTFLAGLVFAVLSFDAVCEAIDTF